MSEFPYKSLPSQAFWRSEVVEKSRNELEPFVARSFKIMKSDRVATAGSCFAQHISRRLQASGFNFYVEEDAPSFLEVETSTSLQYGVYSCRFGNIYTSRQLLQLAKRAFDNSAFPTKIWKLGTRFVDPFRPTTLPGGYRDIETLEVDRAVHLAHVRKMFQNADVFVFTMGLTECWIDNSTGAVLPVCPGSRAGGDFDSDAYSFVNLRFSDVLADMSEFISFIRQFNPNLKIILTVSPVPLVATMEPQSVLLSTCYSKSVLRAVAGELCSRENDVFYFPSYEIVSNSYFANSYFGSDRRTVGEAGVDQVMKVFLANFIDLAADAKSDQASSHSSRECPDDVDADEFVETVCDEVLLDASG